MPKQQPHELVALLGESVHAAAEEAAAYFANRRYSRVELEARHTAQQKEVFKLIIDQFLESAAKRDALRVRKLFAELAKAGQRRRRRRRAAAGRLVLGVSGAKVGRAVQADVELVGFLVAEIVYLAVLRSRWESAVDIEASDFLLMTLRELAEAPAGEAEAELEERPRA